MGTLFVPDQIRTPADRLREALGEIERLMPSLKGAGSKVMELLHLIDQAAVALAELEEAGVDVRAERSRLESIQQQLTHKKARFLTEAGTSFQQEREIVQPDRARWWWFLDEALAQERQQRLRRFLRSAAIVVVALVVALLLYNRFLAPSPEERLAYQRSLTGESYVDSGDLAAALSEFEAAAASAPNTPDYWLWIGAIYQELDDPDKAEAAFSTARSLYGTDFDFWLSRAQVYIRVRNLDAANADLEQAMAEEPESGAPYYVRHSIALEQGDYTAALADLEKTAELANAAGDAQLEGMARMQRAYVLQLVPLEMPTPAATEGGE